jgi:hypothetical protein
LRCEEDIPAKFLKRRLKNKFEIQLSYLRVWHGKELPMEEIYGKLDKLFVQVGAFEEILISTKNPHDFVKF